MKERLSWLPIITFFLAFGLMFAGQNLNIFQLTTAGFLFLGITAILAGIQVIWTKEAFFSPSGSQSVRRRSEHYSGLSAQLWGVFFLLAGVGASLASLVAMLNPAAAQTFLDQFLDTPAGWGILLAGLGVFVSLYGLTRLLAGAAAVSRKFGGRLRDLGYRGLGALSLLIGLALIGLGLVLILAPDLLLTWVEGVIP
jgi:hypothetical protein